MTLTKETIEAWRHTLCGPDLGTEELDEIFDMALNGLAVQPRPEWSYGHCENHKAPGGCQLRNIHCQYPDCDRKPLTSLPEPKI